jgi:hypothetical protein
MGFGLPPDGTRRLTLVIAIGAVVTCLVFFAFALTFLGRPYWKGWWIVMAAILVLAIVAARPLALVIEWVVKGYDKPR